MSFDLLTKDKEYFKHRYDQVMYCQQVATMWNIKYREFELNDLVFHIIVRHCRQLSKLDKGDAKQCYEKFKYYIHNLDKISLIRRLKKSLDVEKIIDVKLNCWPIIRCFGWLNWINVIPRIKRIKVLAFWNQNCFPDDSELLIKHLIVSQINIETLKLYHPKIKWPNIFDSTVKLIYFGEFKIGCLIKESGNYRLKLSGYKDKVGDTDIIGSCKRIISL